MKFDIFHSVGRVDGIDVSMPGGAVLKQTDRDVFTKFFAQVSAAEALGYETIWVAESHFSSEVQKSNPQPVIPHYAGEVGLNCDSPQLAQMVFSRTERIGFGTAIYNIVGGNGGPIGAADRIRSLAWMNALRPSLGMGEPRKLDIGIASGRFPYINKPFGIVPRNEEERILWPQYQSLIFVEALEIFLRLMNDEVISSNDIAPQSISRANFRDDVLWEDACARLRAAGFYTGRSIEQESLSYKARWSFETMKLVPDFSPENWRDFMRFVLGSADPVARNHGLKFADLDIFNLSFTLPAAIDQIHKEMFSKYQELGRSWGRQRMPRTVLIFIDEHATRARERASRCFDTYIEAMRGTAAVPPKDMLMERALIGDADMIREQLSPDDSHGFKADDRLMLWFEFNQTDADDILAQMRLFAERVMPHYM